MGKSSKIIKKREKTAKEAGLGLSLPKKFECYSCTFACLRDLRCMVRTNLATPQTIIEKEEKNRT
jgi:hypothetical protein